MGLRSSIWPPTQRQRIGVAVLVALLLVLNPLYLPVLNLDMSAHTYAVEPVTVDDRTIGVADTSLRGDPIDGVACTGWRPSAGCSYERTHIQQGTLEIELVDPRVEIETRYAYHPGAEDTDYYRRTAAGEPFPESLSLEPVDPETVVESVAVSPEQLSVRARLGLAFGWLQTDQPLTDANRIVDTDDGYVMLVETGRSWLSSGDTVEAGISAFMFLLGLAVLWRTYKRLPAEW
ncbi:MAG: hypothetical protein U9O06_07240 [Euryarchaeota archaeon]|nr:hypothetical protein [Euryarchaeota archaeon]